MNDNGTILGIGHTALDHLLTVERFPDRNSKNEAVDSLRQGGGPVATACVTLARLGNRVDFCGVIGRDAAGDSLVEELAREGVGTELIFREQDSSTPEATVLVEQETAKRTVLLDRCHCRPMTADDVAGIPWERYDYLLLDGKDEAAALLAADAIHRKQGKVMVDLGSLRNDSDALIKASDYCVVSRDFIIDYLPGHEAMQAALLLTAMGPELAVITMGAGGAIWAADGETGWSPPYPVRAVDTTGAGDVYHGALLHALAAGFDLDRSLRFASVCAALKCLQPGGRAGIPNLAGSMKALEEWE